MKLAKQLAAPILLIQVAAFAFLGTLTCLNFSGRMTRALTENYGDQLKTCAQALEELGGEAAVAGLGDTAEAAYLKYQFGRMGKDGYALLKDGDVLRNRTDFDIVNPAARIGDYRIQRLGKRRMLLLKRPLDKLPGYELMAVHDITESFEQTASLGRIFLEVTVLVLALGTAAMFALIRKKLKPLEELKRAAVLIGRGEYAARAKADPAAEKNELGEVTESFNGMAERIEGQIDDLKLLLGALTHEMKTPLTSILGYSDSLLHVKLTDGQTQQAVSHIYREGKRMETLSGKLLQLLGMYENDAVKQEKVSVPELFEAVSQAQEENLRERNVRLQTEIEGTEEELDGDFDLLACLFGNLVQNAARASGEGQTVRLLARARVLSVADCGIGISPEDLPHVTAAFYMADKSRSRRNGGSGLGLALCEQIARLHHAALSIESEPGKGTVVTVDFGQEKR